MIGTRVRRQVYELTLSDLDQHPAWEYALDEEGEEGQDEATVRPHAWTERSILLRGCSLFGHALNWRMARESAAILLADLGATKAHARPHVSNDNPFSEAQFKTLKYRPDFPERFGSIQDARAHGQAFFLGYNTEHRHSGLGLLTPHDVHYGHADQRVAARATVLATA